MWRVIYGLVVAGFFGSVTAAYAGAVPSEPEAETEISKADGESKTEKAELIWGFSVYPPFKYKEDGEYRGIDVRLMRRIVDRLGLKLKFVDCPFKRCLSLIEEGKVDVMTALGLREEREKYVEYVYPPYNVDNKKAFYVRNGSDVEIKAFEDLYKYKIGVKTGVRYFPKFDQDEKIQKEEVYKVVHNLKKLKAGRIDAAVNTQIQMDYLIIEHGFDGKFHTTEYSGEPGRDFIGISKKSPFANRADEFGELIKDLRSSGEMSLIVDRFFDMVRKQNDVVQK